jgi:hypothetical protein
MQMQSLKLDSRILRGTIGAKGIDCLLRMSSVIPAGEYLLLPAVKDAVYGSLLQLVPVGQGATAVPAAGKVDRVASAKFDARAVASIKFDQHTVANKINELAGAPLPGTFVLSAKPMPGRNGIVVERGFSDLVEGLKDGPLRVTVR